MHLNHHSRFGVVLQQPRLRPASTSSLFGAWRDLWRSAPADVRRDTVGLFLLAPLILDLFAIAWVMLP